MKTPTTSTLNLHFASNLLVLSNPKVTSTGGPHLGVSDNEIIHEQSTFSIYALLKLQSKTLLPTWFVMGWPVLVSYRMSFGARDINSGISHSCKHGLKSLNTLPLLEEVVSIVVRAKA